MNNSKQQQQPNNTSNNFEWMKYFQSPLLHRDESKEDKRSPIKIALSDRQQTKTISLASLSLRV
eukprot:gene3655-2589_t